MKNSRKSKLRDKYRQVNDRVDAIDEDLQQKLLDQLNAYGNNLLGEVDELGEIRDSKQKVDRTRGGNDTKDKEKNKITDEDSRKALNDEKRPAKKTKRKAWEENLRMELINFSNSTESNPKGETSKATNNGPEIIVFEDRAKRKKTVSEASQDLPDNSCVTSMGQLREFSHEVYQFGLSGFDFENKEKLEMQRAIKLGAKPPKKTHMPYKEFMKLQKQKKEEDLKQRETDRKMGLQVKKKTSDRDRKRDLVLRKSGFWQDPTKKRTFSADGQVGRFKSGVQVLSRQDIHQIKRGKGKSRGRRTTKS